MTKNKTAVTVKYAKLFFPFLCLLAVVITEVPDLFQASASKPSTAVLSSPRLILANSQQSENFEAMPPIAAQLLVQKLPNSTTDTLNLLLTAQLQESELRFRPKTQFTMQLDEKRTVTFSDRGENGDRLARDGIFSTNLTLSNKEFTQLVEANNQLVRKIDVQPGFVLRSLVLSRLQMFRIDDFRAGEIVPLTLVSNFRVNAKNIDDLRSKSLMITDYTVVDDLDKTYDPCRKNRAGSPNKGNANGPWSFKTLMDNIANTPVTGVPTKDFVVDWVDQFLFSASTHPISNDSAPNRTTAKDRFIKAWMRNSGLTVPANVPANWKSLNLKVEEFPVRLLAIVNRLDLRGNHGYGTLNNAGEGRLVFSFVDSNQNCSVRDEKATGVMTLIFEYAVPITSCVDLQAYASKWWDLHQQPFGLAFNSKLVDLTNVFTAANVTVLNPNRSALKHLRTNEFLTAPWNLRDFVLDSKTKKLTIVHPDKEPMGRSNGFAPGSVNPQKLQDLVAFVNALSFGSGNPAYTIPDSIAGIHAPINTSNLSVPAINGSEQFRFHWRGSTNQTISSAVNRREFSFNTCSGCHTGETATPFLHIEPRSVGSNSVLSGFMTGLGTDDINNDNDTDPLGRFTVNDPGPAPLRPKEFNEAFERALSLERLVFNSICISVGPAKDLSRIAEILRFHPKNMAH